MPDLVTLISATVERSEIDTSWPCSGKLGAVVYVAAEFVEPSVLSTVHFLETAATLHCVEQLCFVDSGSC